MKKLLILIFCISMLLISISSVNAKTTTAKVTFDIGDQTEIEQEDKTTNLIYIVSSLLVIIAIASFFLLRNKKQAGCKIKSKG